jgi:hypothetical protein
MKQEESLNKIISLLEKLEGVKIIHTYCTQERMDILLTIESDKSHFWLEYCSEGANVPFKCCTRLYPWDKEAIDNPSLALTYSFEIIKKASYATDFENFNFLGSFLVWVMHCFGLIATKEANCLLDFWGSMHVDEKRRVVK